MDKIPCDECLVRGRCIPKIRDEKCCSGCVSSNTCNKDRITITVLTNLKCSIIDNFLDIHYETRLTNKHRRRLKALRNSLRIKL